MVPLETGMGVKGWCVFTSFTKISGPASCSGALVRANDAVTRLVSLVQQVKLLVQALGVAAGLRVPPLSWTSRMGTRRSAGDAASCESLDNQATVGKVMCGCDYSIFI